MDQYGEYAYLCECVKIFDLQKGSILWIAVADKISASHIFSWQFHEKPDGEMYKIPLSDGYAFIQVIKH